MLGLGVRGHTGSDGRVLLLVDGIEINEQRFGTAQLGSGFPLESIERIEIVRGSALAMYGATAELGVIHIVTRKPAEIDGAILTTQQGIASGEHSRDERSPCHDLSPLGLSDPCCGGAQQADPHFLHL